MPTAKLAPPGTVLMAFINPVVVLLVIAGRLPGVWLGFPSSARWAMNATQKPSVNLGGGKCFRKNTYEDSVRTASARKERNQ